MKNRVVAFIVLCSTALAAAEWTFPAGKDPASVFPPDQALAFPDGFKATVRFSCDLGKIDRRTRFGNLFCRGADFHDGYCVMVRYDGFLLIDILGVDPQYYMHPTKLESNREYLLELYVTKTSVRVFIDGKETGSFCHEGTLDYAKMSEAMKPLVELMKKTDRVRLVGPGTDLSFSIKGIPVIPCDGKMNIPDGEIFTAPVRESVNGTIRYNTETLYMGTKFSGLEFTFRDGKIVEAKGNPQDRLDAVLDSDEGARYVGEFAIGVNPFVRKPMLDTLFDEKIAGSIHFTPGNSYDEAPNGNKSQVHWDIVLIQTKEAGGGEIWFDDTLVRKDGLFVLDSLKGLNPESLGG